MSGPPAMDDALPTRPPHLRPVLASRRGWLAARPAGTTSAALGILAFVVVTVAQPGLWSTPDWRISVPGVIATAIAAGISVARREQAAYPLWLAGLGLAVAALVLGWFLMLAIVIGVTVVSILILHALM